MATGITASLQMDPTTKVEIWLFQKIGVVGGGRAGGNNRTPQYRRLPYNLVSYDGDPTQYIEPATHGDFNKVLDGSGDPIDPRTAGACVVAGFQYYDGRPFEVFALNDLDVAGNLGQLP